MNDFLSPRKATEKDLKASWLCGKNGIYFRCAFCGYKFVVNDYYRIIVTNDIPDAYGNPIICKKCNDKYNGNTSDLRELWREKHRIAKTDFWWFTERN